MKAIWQSSVHRRTALVLLAALLLGIFVVGQAVLPAQAQTTNLAQGRPVTCSSTENAAFPCANAVDGNSGTRWSSAFSDPQWIQVDLGATYSINRVVLNWEAAYGRSYQIQVSTNASTWTNVYSTTSGNGGTDDLTVSGSGRYVRMYGTARATQYGYSLFEFQVYGGGTPPPTTPPPTTPPPTTPPPSGNLAQGRPVTCSSVENAGTPCANAVDGNTGTRWSSAYSDPQWIQVDLGATYSISRVVLLWETAYGRSYQIQVSTNASTWTNIYSTTSSNGGTDDLTVSGPGRYVRMYGTARATQWGYSLWEFQVYGGGTPPPTTPPPTTPPPTTPPPTTQPGQAPYGGTPRAVPGTIQAEDYDTGGEGVAYHDTTSGNSGGAYRSDGVDIQATSDTGGGNNIGWTANGEWLEYTINATTSGTYTLSARVAAPSAGATIHAEIDGANVTGAMSIPATGAWQTWTTVNSGSFSLSAGQHVLRIAIDVAGMNLNWVSLQSGTVPPTTPPATATPTRTPTPTPSTPTGPVMLSYHAPAFASSVQDNANCAGCTADKVVDVDMGTRWATDWSDPQWIYLDLGATANITRVVLKWEAAYASAYQIQVSSNASSWTPIYSTTTGDGGTDDLAISGSGRYVRMYGTTRATGYGYSLFEFEVYGTGGAPQASPTPRPTSTPHGAWVLAWSDEFNGPGINTSNWNFETGCTGWGNGEWEDYTNGGNSSIAFDSQANSNVMIIEARLTGASAACNYTSSRMTTIGKREFTYGRIEARLKLPHTQGIWPAFWMMGNNISTVGWPYNGEIDIMEHVGFPANTNITSGALHGPGYSGGDNIGGEFRAPEAVNLNYHIYAIEWSPEGISWFVDNNNFLNVTRQQVETRGQWVYDHPFFILLNVAVGGAWPGYPDATSQFPQRMYVDYVRVYE